MIRSNVSQPGYQAVDVRAGRQLSIYQWRDGFVKRADTLSSRGWAVPHRCTGEAVLGWGFKEELVAGLGTVVTTLGGGEGDGGG